MSQQYKMENWNEVWHAFPITTHQLIHRFQASPSCLIINTWVPWWISSSHNDGTVQIRYKNIAGENLQRKRKDSLVFYHIVNTTYPIIIWAGPWECYLSYSSFWAVTARKTCYSCWIPHAVDYKWFCKSKIIRSLFKIFFSKTNQRLLAVYIPITAFSVFRTNKQEKYLTNVLFQISWRLN